MIGVADPSLRSGLPPAPAADALTHVELTWVEKKIEFWIRFGREIAEQILDRRRRVVSFAPDSVFAFVRWTSNDYGTALSRLDIVRAVHADVALAGPMVLAFFALSASPRLSRRLPPVVGALVVGLIAVLLTGLAAGGAVADLAFARPVLQAPAWSPTATTPQAPAPTTRQATSLTALRWSCAIPRTIPTRRPSAWIS